jgi:hypothetical protein
VIFTNSRNFKVNIKERFDKATRAMFDVIARCKEQHLYIVFGEISFSPDIEKLSIKIYHLVYKKDFQWLRFIKNILNECGLSYLWTTEYSTLFG